MAELLDRPSLPSAKGTWFDPFVAAFRMADNDFAALVSLSPFALLSTLLYCIACHACAFTFASIIHWG